MITSEKPKVDPTARYSAKEASALLDIHRSTLERYTKQGYIKCGYRKVNKRKYYTGVEIIRLWEATER